MRERERGRDAHNLCTCTYMAMSAKEGEVERDHWWKSVVQLENRYNMHEISDALRGYIHSENSTHSRSARLRVTLCSGLVAILSDALCYTAPMPIVE